MFDIARLRPNLGERLGLYLVLLVLALCLAAPVVTLLDGQRRDSDRWAIHQAPPVLVVESTELALSAASDCPCADLVVHVPTKVEVPAMQSL